MSNDPSAAAATSPPPPPPPENDGPRVEGNPGKLGGAWRAINNEVAGRSELLAAAYDRLAGYGIHHPVRFRLAATDAFVEKAQHRLTRRAIWLNIAGAFAAAAALALLLVAADYVRHIDMGKRLGAHAPGEAYPAGTGYLLTLLILQSVSVGGFVAGAAYFLAALAKAFFHEGSVLLARRHALRFGRLFVYLRNGEVEPDLLMRAFRWTDDFGSAFEHLKEEGIKAGVGKIFEAVPQVVEASAKFVEAAKPSKT